MCKITIDNVYAFIKDSSVDCIAIEAGSTIKHGKYYSIQHPKCYEAFDRTFGEDWKWVLGASLLSMGTNSNEVTDEDMRTGCFMIPAVYSPPDFVPLVVPTVLRFKKIIVAVVVKPPTNIPGFQVDPMVDMEGKTVVPGYLCATRIEDVGIASRRLSRFADKANLRNIVVAPFCKTDFYLQPRETAKIMSDHLDDRFTIALGGF